MQMFFIGRRAPRRVLNNTRSIGGGCWALQTLHIILRVNEAGAVGLEGRDNGCQGEGVSLGHQVFCENQFVLVVLVRIEWLRKVQELRWILKLVFQGWWQKEHLVAILFLRQQSVIKNLERILEGCNHLINMRLLLLLVNLFLVPVNLELHRLPHIVLEVLQLHLVHIPPVVVQWWLHVWILLRLVLWERRHDVVIWVIEQRHVAVLVSQLIVTRLVKYLRDTLRVVRGQAFLLLSALGRWHLFVLWKRRSHYDVFRDYNGFVNIWWSLGFRWKLLWYTKLSRWYGLELSITYLTRIPRVAKLGPVICI